MSSESAAHRNGLALIGNFVCIAVFALQSRIFL
jgi:hypothetical protein